MPVPYVGQRFDLAEFKEYLETIQFSGFQPQFVTLHHTGAPSLAQRPTGFSEQHLKNLLHYYQNQLGWSGAPHLFVDDRAEGIIVFQRLDQVGVHAKSFNSKSWGVEMLGNYDVENFHAGRGAKVRDCAMEAVAAMCRRLGVAAETIRFHRDYPLTKKSCPGKKVSKPDVVARVAALLQVPPPPDMGSTEAWKAWKVVLPSGKSYVPVHVEGGRPIVAIRSFLNELLPGGDFKLAPDHLTVRWSRPGGEPVDLPVAELDADGASWALVRDLAEAANRTLQVQGRTVRIG